MNYYVGTLHQNFKHGLPNNTREEHDRRKQPNFFANKYSMCIFATFGTTNVNH
jgi:hypothetical protein